MITNMVVDINLEDIFKIIFIRIRIVITSI